MLTCVFLSFWQGENDIAAVERCLVAESDAAQGRTKVSHGSFLLSSYPFEF